MPRRSEILRSRIVTLALLASLSACTPPASSRRQSSCEPACRAGFVCVDMACVSACNPPCSANTVCSARGECVAPGSDAGDVVADAIVQPDVPFAFDGSDLPDAPFDAGTDAGTPVDVPIAPVCEPPLLACGSECVDPMIDLANCQRCGIACSADVDQVATCSNGFCDSHCRSGWAFILGSCMPSPTPGGVWNPIAGLPRQAVAPVPAFWNGREMIALWMSLDPSSGYVAGWAYNPNSDSWRTISASGAPRPRSRFAVAFDGARVFIWGGEDPSTHALLGDGYVYDSVMDGWSPVTTARAPTARRDASAVWAGNRFIVWGGADDSGPLNSGAELHPSGAWTPIVVDSRNTPTPRIRASLTWTGREVIVWGGCTSLGATSTDCFGDGAIYVPTTLTWRAMNPAGAPSPRVDFARAWTGHEWIVWGGGVTDAVGTSTLRTDGARYDPRTDRWTALPDAPIGGRLASAYAWTGTDFLVWGGRAPGAFLGDGARFDPVTNTWTLLDAGTAPTSRSDAWAAWTGFEFVVMGGQRETGPLAYGRAWRQ